MKPPKYKVHDCPYCGTYGKHYWHHVFNASLKKKSEQYGAVIYPCWACHVTNKDSIHNNAEWRRQLKQEHQARIMDEYSMNMDDWRRVFGENYL